MGGAAALRVSNAANWSHSLTWPPLLGFLRRGGASSGGGLVAELAVRVGGGCGTDGLTPAGLSRLASAGISASGTQSASPSMRTESVPTIVSSWIIRLISDGENGPTTFSPRRICRLAIFSEPIPMQPPKQQSPGPQFIRLILAAHFPAAEAKTGRPSTASITLLRPSRMIPLRQVPTISASIVSPSSEGISR
jgi:hypothetical protein